MEVIYIVKFSGYSSVFKLYLSFSVQYSSVKRTDSYTNTCKQEGEVGEMSTKFVY